MKPGNRSAEADSGANSRGGFIRRKMRRMGIFRVRLVFRAARFFAVRKGRRQFTYRGICPTEERKTHP